MMAIVESLVRTAGLESALLGRRGPIRIVAVIRNSETVSNPRVGMALTGHKSHAARMNYIHALAEQLAQLITDIGKIAAKPGAAKARRRKRPIVIRLPEFPRRAHDFFGLPGCAGARA